METVLNTQNDRIYACDAEDFPEGSRIHLHRVKTIGVMVWAAVASNGSKSPFFFIPEKKGK